MGLVSRKVDPKDRRKYVISLTERGLALEVPALQAAIAANVAATKGIPDSDRDLCLCVLRQAYQNLLKKDRQQ
jgi:DNA-binding MarR family transcriptional regulator